MYTILLSGLIFLIIFGCTDAHTAQPHCENAAALLAIPAQRSGGKPNEVLGSDVWELADSLILGARRALYFLI